MLNWRKQLLQLSDTLIKQNHIHEQLRELRQFHARPLTEQLGVQRTRLETLLHHAGERVPHYRHVLREAEVWDGQSVSLNHWSQIPILTKEDLRTRFDELTSDDLAARRWLTNRSGGSTGQPVTLLQDISYKDLNIATMLYQFEAAGLVLGQPYIKLWGSDRDVLEGGIGTKATLANWLRNRTFLNSFRMTPSDMEQIIETIRQVRPRLIESYADGITEVAQYINAHELSVPRVPAIISSAGNLFDFMREEMTRAFGATIYNRYGTREVGDCAFEYEPGRLDVELYTHLIEVVDSDGLPVPPGEEGEVLVTCLSNFVMPIIRYRIGDRALVAAVSDVPVPSVTALKTVTGRITESFVRADGTLVSAFFFIHFLGVVHNQGWVKKVQVVQEDVNRVRVRLAVLHQPDDTILADLTTSIQKVMGEDCAVAFEFVDDIPLLPSGKYQYTRSLVREADQP